MPRKSKDAAEKKANLSRLKQIWSEVSLDDWTALLAEYKPEHRFIRRGPSIKGLCPFHDDQTPSFIISPLKGIAKCFSANCNKTFTHPVFFVSALLSAGPGSPPPVRFSEAIQILRKRFGLKGVITDALFERAKAFEEHQDRKKKCAEYMGRKLFEALGEYPNLNNNLGYAQGAVEFLLSRRLGVDPGEDTTNDKDPGGIFGALTTSQVLGIFPPMLEWEKDFQADPDTLTWARQYFHQFFDGFAWVGSIVFIMHDEPGSVSRFKLRQPDTSGAGKKTFAFAEGDQYEKDNDGYRGLLGIQHYSTFLGRGVGKEEQMGDEDDSVSLAAVVVEGEFDALQPLAHQVRHQSDDFIILALGGSSLQPLDRLSELGIKTVRIISDMDDAGTGIIKKVLERAQTDRVGYEVFVWPEEYKNYRNPADPQERIKDPDEAIKILGWAKFCKYVNSRDSYVKAHEWVYDCAERELSRVPGGDLRQLQRIALDWGRLLKNRSECDGFCKQIEKGFGLDHNTLSRDIWAANEDEAAFIDRIMRTLKEQFEFIGRMKGENRREILTAYHRVQKHMVYFVLNDEKSTETTLSRYYGAIYKFIIDNMAEPAFLAAEGEEVSSISVEQKTKRYRMYTTLALLNLSQNLPSVDTTNRRGQGVHVVKSTDVEMISYIVNGTDVYQMRHTDGTFDVTPLDGPAHAGLIFKNEGETWLPTLHAPDDIVKANVDPKELFQTLKNMISIGWRWRHQELDSTFLATYVMCLSVMALFTRQTAIILNAEAQSGKSRFTSGFIGGKGFPRIHLVAHAVTMQAYTAAAIRAQRDGSSLALCLEEFEDYGSNDNKTAVVKRVLEMFRDMISEGGVTASIGTKNGESLSFHLQFPVICSAIRPLRDQASLSRFIAFELVKEDSREDPQNVLLEAYGDEGIAKARHELAVGLMPHMKKLAAMQRDIEREFAKGANLPKYATARFREGLFPILTMLKFLGEDYQKFAFEFSESRKEQLGRLTTTAENEQLFESILSSPFTIANAEGRVSWTTSIRSLLSSLNDLALINQTRKGVYFDAKNEWLIVNWIEAAQGVLSQTRFANESPVYFKQIAERSPYIVKEEDAQKDKVLGRMMPHMGPGHHYDLVSVYSVRHLLDKAREQQENFRKGGNGSATPPVKTGGTLPMETSLHADSEQKAQKLGDSDDDIIA